MHTLCSRLSGMLLTIAVVTPARQDDVTWHELCAKLFNVFSDSFIQIFCSKLSVIGSTHLMRMHALCLPLGRMLLITNVVTPALRWPGHAGLAWHEF